MFRMAIVCVLVGAACGATTTQAAPALGLEDPVVAFTPAGTSERWATTVYDRHGAGKAAHTQWRAIQRTGNCCENYLTSTRQGRLLDFGGGSAVRLRGGGNVNFTDDGVTWHYVESTVENGPEGAAAIAPGGDVLGVSWDPYRGDLLETYRFDAATGRWLSSVVPAHTPFFDRPWIAVVPGPVTTPAGDEVPYATVATGSAGDISGLRELAVLQSYDGLTYLPLASKTAGARVGTALNGPLPITRVADADWIQASVSAGLTPLGGGRLLMAPDAAEAAAGLPTGWAVYDASDRSFRPFAFPGGAVPEGHFQVDSLGRLHNVVSHSTSFTYRVSRDGGAGWTAIEVPLGDGLEFNPDSVAELWDFRANAEEGIGAVAVHAWDPHAQADQDVVYTIDLSGDGPRLLRRAEVGLGDVNATHSFDTTDALRFDFASVTILPGARVASSYMDSTTVRGRGTYGAPGFAIEGATVPGPPPTPAAGVAQPPLHGTVVVTAPAPRRVTGLNTAPFAFDVPQGADDASLMIHATHDLPADVDLYLYRRLANGTWTEYLDEGSGDSTEDETLHSGRLIPGHYRVDVVEGAGPPHLAVDLDLVFASASGTAGA